MTRDQLVKLADDLSFIPSKEDGLVDLGCVTDVERDAIVTALHRLASSEDAVKGEPEPVAWIDFVDNGNVCLWTSEKRRADAEIASGRKMTPVYTAPPADAGMREALEIIQHEIENCKDEQWYRAIQNAFQRIKALTAPGATTKSDGGVEGHAFGRPIRSESEQGSRCCVEAISRSAIPAGRPLNAEEPRAETSECSPNETVLVSASKHRTHSEGIEALPNDAGAGIKPGPSDLNTSPELLALIERAKNHVMTPEEIHEQRRSFAKGMCPSHRDYKEWCAQIDKLMPPLSPSDPSSTRSDVTVEFGDLVDDLLLVVAEVRRQNWKNGGAHLYDDEDAARKIARALLETHQIRRK